VQIEHMAWPENTLLSVVASRDPGQARLLALAAFFFVLPSLVVR
jgi:hypothetical protein